MGEELANSEGIINDQGEVRVNTDERTDRDLEKGEGENDYGKLANIYRETLAKLTTLRDQTERREIRIMIDDEIRQIDGQLDVAERIANRPQIKEKTDEERLNDALNSKAPRFIP